MKIDIGQYMIRDWKRDDAAALARHANNPNIASNLRDRFPYPYTFADAESFLSSLDSAVPCTVFAIASNAEAIGGIGLTFGEDVHRLSAELGYWLAEPYWGQGIMTSAVKAVTRYGFSEFGLNRVYAEPYSSNPASSRVLEKAGFVCEGTMRANVVKNGSVLDQQLFAMIKNGIT